jgi:hypothetical protein
MGNASPAGDYWSGRARAEKEYVDGLEHFLDASHEDEADIEGLWAQFPRFAPQTWAHLKKVGLCSMLDVGAGNGAKAVALAQKLNVAEVAVQVHSIEPRAEQRAHLLETHRRLGNCFLGKVHDRPVGEAGAVGTHDLVLLIHSLYEFPRHKDGSIASLDVLPHLMTDNGVAVVMIEHPEGDFQKMKRALYPFLGKMAPVSKAALEATLRRLDLRHDIGDIIKFNFDLNDVMDQELEDIGHVMAFLFSDSLDDGLLGVDALRLIGQWIVENARWSAEEGYHLWTPDLAVWVHPA